MQLLQKSNVSWTRLRYLIQSIAVYDNNVAHAKQLFRCGEKYYSTIPGMPEDIMDMSELQKSSEPSIQ